MEGFLEANRVVEVSFNKLTSIHKRGDLPLRKTLLISKVLNRAQDAATSAHFAFMNGPSSSTPRGSSKLLASISKKVVEDASIYESDCLPSGPLYRPTKPQHRQQSPIASSALAKAEEDEEPMDFDSVNSVLSNILSFDNDNTAAPNSSETESPRSRRMSLSHPQSPSNRNEVSSPTRKRSRLLKDVSNSSKDWSSWQLELSTDFVNASTTYQWPSTTQDASTTWSPPSPGKRPHSEAFPCEKENLFLFETSFEDPKRFKPSPPEGCPLESLPGFCGYLSYRGLQSSPQMTNKFGNSDPNSSDWPSCYDTHHSSDSEQGLTYQDQSFSDNHFPAPIPTQISPILAFWSYSLFFHVFITHHLPTLATAATFHHCIYVNLSLLDCCRLLLQLLLQSTSLQILSIAKSALTLSLY